jgi:thioredoxin-related protein
MNKMLIVPPLLLLSTTASLFAEGVQWRNWKDGLGEAKAQNKLLLVDAVREGCHYCEEMQRAVFDDAEIAARIEERFVPVKVDLSKEGMPLGLKVAMTPSFYFLTPDAKVIKFVPGSWNREDFGSFLDGVVR